MASQNEPTRASRPCLLIVEDEELVALVLEDILCDYYEVVRVAAADDALSVLAGRGVHVLLLDHLLPGGGSQRVAEQAVSSGVPMVWMTGDPGDGRLALDRSRPVLAKPFAAADVLRALREAESLQAGGATMGRSCG